MDYAVEEIDGNSGIFRVLGHIWTVKREYKLLDIIGSGAYGIVCKGINKITSQMIAIKRMTNVLYGHEYGKRVLREICIMRRLTHPNVLFLLDTFTGESQKGTDLYIVTEFADLGSLCRYGGQLASCDVKIILQQILEGVQYMHSCGVWHRDLKPDNILLCSPMKAKICDFNLARSVEEVSRKYVNEDEQRRSHQSRRYTTMVATRNYRAPEVIMSHGEYTSAIDMWSVGCIFWELLNMSNPKDNSTKFQRCLFNPKLEQYKTPKDQENFLEDGDKYRFQLLNDIFTIIGTPSWKDIESIPSHKWRKYLKNVPGRVGKLSKTLGDVNYEALDLLSRMLYFDPSHRCTATEALSHYYFKNMDTNDMDIEYEYFKSAQPSREISLHEIEEPSVALQHLEEEIKKTSEFVGSGMIQLKVLLENEVNQVQQHLLKQNISMEEESHKKRSYKHPKIWDA